MTENEGVYARPPEGSVLLSTDDAVNAIVSGDHPEAGLGTVEQDAALVELLRSGEIQACRLPDGKLGFQSRIKNEEGE